MSTKGGARILTPYGVVDRDFARILARAGVTAITFHEARHTYATIALKHGIPAKVVQERLGHSDIGVTLNIYSHVTPGLGRRAAAQMGAILGGAEGEPGAAGDAAAEVREA